MRRSYAAPQPQQCCRCPWEGVARPTPPRRPLGTTSESATADAQRFRLASGGGVHGVTHSEQSVTPRSGQVWLWTWGGECFGYRDGDELWTYDGRHVGRFQNDEIYGSSGSYLGELGATRN